MEILAGTKNILKQNTSLFNSLNKNFLDELSKNLFNLSSSKKYPDILAFAFWCRKTNLNLIQKNLSDKHLRYGIGTIFHITPSNVPTNFCYSFAFGFLTGNSNIVKVPSIDFPQVGIICGEIKKLFKLKKYLKLSKSNLFVKYKSEEHNVTFDFSKISDGRIIWGGDESIKNIKKIEAKIDTVDLIFKDKYSFSILDAKKILSLNNSKMENLTYSFYNDTYSLDQNACSSPHLIIWRGTEKNILNAKNLFWNEINKIVEKKYKLERTHSVEKYLNFCLDAVNLKNSKKYITYKNLVNRMEIKNLPNNISKLKGIFGYFYEYNCKSLNIIKSVIDSKIQTITYFGIARDDLVNFVSNSDVKGINRVVPVGKALSMGFTWDGFEIEKKLTRLIEII